MTFQFRRPARPVDRVFVHCSASDHKAHDNVATMREWHLQRGWSDVGYHYFIRKDGTLEIGRPLEQTPAAQGGHNRGTIAICLHGLAEDRFTEAQFKTLIGLCQQIDAAYRGRITFHGHNEVAAKLCPVFDHRRILDLNSRGDLGALELHADVPQRTVAKIDQLEEAEAGVLVHAHRPTLRFGIRGHSPDVTWLQRELVKLGYHVGKIDGDFGGRTRSAVLAFQKDNHLIADGIVGQATYEALTDAQPREIGEKRASAGLLDLAKGGSRIATASVNGQTASGLLTAGGALAIFEQSTGTISRLSEGAKFLKSTVAMLGPWIGVGVIAIGVYLGWQAWQAGRARVDDHRTGKTS